MRKKMKKKVDKETMCDDWCFRCKDGGSLLICDYGDCLKAYHSGCVGKDESFSESGQRLKCEWHSCFNCHKPSKYHCYCCPRAWCRRCIIDAEFVNLRGDKGFCIDCLKVLLLGEEQKEVDSDGEQVNMKDRNTYECLLYEYWIIIKGKENLTLEDLHYADKLMKRGDIQASLSNPSVSDEHADESLVCSSEEESSDSEFSITLVRKGKRSKSRKLSKKTEGQSKNIEFVDWGSKPLHDFLASIGEDTSEELSENDVESIINKYIMENNLFSPEKKKKILCDEKLRALLGRKTLLRNRLRVRLEFHFLENQQYYSTEEKSENDSTTSKKLKKTVTCKTSQKKEVAFESPRSCFASIVTENIKLVYLKKCLVMELLKEPETFEQKVVGSFVRVKSDPYDCMQKNPDQLVKVTGVKNTSPGWKKEDILLEVSNRFKDFPINELSDANFSEQECEDLRERVKSGQLQKLTIVEIEKKAKSLHQIIMEHWIAKEKRSLQILIDQANEKGWRAEFSDYTKRLTLLNTEAERKRLLNEVPNVIADVPEIEPIPEDANREAKNGNELLSISIITKNSKTLGRDNMVPFGDKAVACGNSFSSNTGCISANNGNERKKQDEIPDSDEDGSACHGQSAAIRTSLQECGSQVQSQSHEVEKKMAETEKTSPIELSSDIASRRSLRQCSSQVQSQSHYVEQIKPKAERISPVELVNDDAIRRSLQQCGSQVQSKSHEVEQTMAKTEKTLIIELSSDDDSCDSSKISLSEKNPEALDEPVWYYLGPNGERNGPYSISILKRWGDATDYAMKCKVWKAGESEVNAVPWSSAVRQFYSVD